MPLAQGLDAVALKKRVRELKFLVVGLGSAGRRHAANLSALGAERLEAVSEFRGLSSYEAGGMALRVHPEYERGLEAGPDVVVLANPTSLHARYSAMALESGCHVYLEKPAASSAREALALIGLSQKVRRAVAVGNQLRFAPCLERLKGMVEEGCFGRILDVHVNMGEHLPDYHPEEDYRKSYAAQRKLGGGVLLTQIHDINYLSWIFGPFETAYATGGKVSDLEIDVEDSVSFLLRAASGLGVSVHMDYLQRRRSRTLSVTWERAGAVWDYYGNTLSVTDSEGKTGEFGPEEPLDRNRLFLDAMTDFLRCAQDGGCPRTSLPEAVNDLRAVDAVRLSLSSGKAEAIEK